MQGSNQSTMRPRILIADDHSVVAEGLRSLLDKSYDVVGVVHDGRALLVEASNLKPDVIILDIGMPLLNGMDAAERLKLSLPSAKLVFLTMKDDANLAAAALNLGTVGYVLKNAAASELLKAVSEVLQGRSYVTAKLRPENWAIREARARQYSKELTPRQQEVLQLLAEGRAMKEIADILSVSEKTVMFHKYHIMELFNLKNNAELVLFALNRHLISSDPLR
ncbi:response regulator transcription factor [Alloacidobacterium sp.]|uniref:response regulator transcription factor n=1 Tax=Alloacidobacterium sp. TaxID=2951999 RepID=UPI002D76C9B3|nr:response regulator transcription factor [Alloacidobacterium sp.]